MRPSPPCLGERGHVVDHIAERGCLDEQDIGHEPRSSTRARRAGCARGSTRLHRPRALVTGREGVHALPLTEFSSALASNRGQSRRAQSMTVLITGGAGYIGSHMVHALCAAGERVVVLDNLSTGFDWAVAKGVPLIVADVGEQSRVAALISEHAIDAIIHFAASVVVPDSVRDPLGYYRNNTVNSRALIEMAVNGGVRHFILSSTAAVYGNPERAPLREDDPTVPISPYGSSKLMSEIMLRDASAAHDLRHVILRYFNVAGADPLGRTGQSTRAATHLIKVALEAAVGLRPKVEVFGTDYPTPDG